MLTEFLFCSDKKYYTKIDICFLRIGRIFKIKFLEEYNKISVFSTLPANMTKSMQKKVKILKIFFPKIPKINTLIS